MALIKCSECGKEISNKAEACPYCGCPLSAMAESKSLQLSKSVENIVATNKKSKKSKKMKPWMLIVGAVVLMVVILSIVISVLSVKYNWDEVILKSVLPEPTSNYGSLYTNDADNLYLSVEKVSFSEYETYVAGCIDKGFTYVVESSASSYSAFNSDGYELELDYYEYDEVLDISLHVRVSGTIKWSTRKLVDQLPVPNSNVGSIVNNHDEHYEVYVGNTYKDEFDTYISECEANGFNLNIQRQENSFYAENELGYELTVEYYACDLIYIDLDVPGDDKDTDESNDKESNQQTLNKTGEDTKVEENSYTSFNETESNNEGEDANSEFSPYDYATIVCQSIKDSLYNPDSLQIHKVYYVDAYWHTYYIDFSAMNQMGGYTRQSYEALFNQDSSLYSLDEVYDLPEIFEEVEYDVLDTKIIESNLK